MPEEKVQVFSQTPTELNTESPEHDRSIMMNRIYSIIDKMDCESLKIVHINIKRIFLYGA